MSWASEVVVDEGRLERDVAPRTADAGRAESGLSAGRCDG